VLAAAVLDALGELQKSPAGGCIRTIGRLADTKPASFQAALKGGAPAILIYYGGWVTTGQDATGQLETDKLTFQLFCVAPQPTTVALRQAGDDPDSETATMPGVEDMQDWARWLTIRALRTAGARQIRTRKGSQAFRVTPEAFVGTVTITCEREVDSYDDDSATLLLQIGIVHDPTNGYGAAAAWFEGDNTTPISDWPPPGTDGGVATL